MLESGLVRESDLQKALEEQKKSRLKLGDQLVDMGILSHDQIMEVLQKQLNIPRVTLDRQTVGPDVVKVISGEMAEYYQIFPLKLESGALTLAMADPLDYYAIDDVRLSTGYQVQPVLAHKDEISLAIQRHYGMQKSVERMLRDLSAESRHAAVDEHEHEAERSPVIEVVDQLIQLAVQLGASDIHIDPGEHETSVRYRVDGMLRTERKFPADMHAVLVSRIKILAQLDIAEKRLPQDGRINMTVEYRDIDIRVSVLPTVFGEKIVMRVLDRSRSLARLEELGLSERQLEIFRKMLKNPHGLVLVTGPTGSGKTTTLYSALQEMNREEVNIITIEDPVEYQLKGINQVQVIPSIGLTFARGLRSILRQDPNIIMIGEIRDQETAEIALRAALTGHFVFSTLHTNDSVSTITRLIDMGSEPYLVAASLIGVVAQRLVRKVCPHCKQRRSLFEEEKALFLRRNLPIDEVAVGAGCHRCQHTGYKGRIPVYEMLMMDTPLRNMITRLVPEADIRAHLEKQGFSSLFDEGLQQAALGNTTLEEVFRVAAMDG